MWCNLGPYGAQPPGAPGSRQDGSQTTQPQAREVTGKMQKYRENEEWLGGNQSEKAGIGGKEESEEK